MTQNRTYPTYQLAAPYRRNKNLFLEGVEDSWLDKALRKILDLFASLIRAKCRVVFSEQIVEYPFVYQHIGAPPQKVLDFGCNENILPIQLCALGHKVTGIGMEPYPFAHKNFEFIQKDILVDDLAQDEYDSVIAISSVEHIGIIASGYGSQECQEGDKVAVAKLIKALKPGGKLIMTVPAGKPALERGMRIYAAEQIRQLVPNVQLLRFFRKTGRYGDWEECSESEIGSLIYDQYRVVCPVQGVALILMVKSR